MDSPYRPGFGARPAVFVGRESQLGRVRTALTRLVNSGQSASTVLVLTGPRGLGKTVMLDVVADEAAERGLVVVQAALDSASDGVQLLAGRLAIAAELLPGSGSRNAWQTMRRRLAQLSLEVNTGIVKVIAPAVPQHEEARVASAREHLAALLTETAAMAVRAGRRGLVVLIDELQQGRLVDLIVITNALQDASRTAGAPIATFAAGLPNTPDRVAEAASFAERYRFDPLQRLTPDQSERALIEPALAHGVTWSPEAADAVLAAADGSPYLIQLFGDEVWLQADPDPEDALTMEQTVVALRDARERLHDGLFRSRWAKTTGAERQLLLAIAETADADGIAETRDYTARMGRTAQQLSSTRHALIDKGLVESVARGRLTFTIPGFKEYILERTGSD